MEHWRDQEYFLSPLDGMLVHRRATPGVKFANPFIHLGGERHFENRVFWPRIQQNVPGQG